MVNNKNIKHAANPKEGGNEETVESESLQKKKKERQRKRTKGISFWYRRENIVRWLKREGGQGQGQRSRSGRSKYMKYAPGR